MFRWRYLPLFFGSLCLVSFTSLSARAEETSASSAPANPVPITATAPQSHDEQLYYAVERQFPANKKIEARTAFAYDFSNPYLHMMGGQAAVFYSVSRYVALGLEGSLYTTDRKGSANQLEQELKRHGYRLKTAAPEYGGHAILRLTPFSGVVNFFSSNVMQADVSLLLRSGAMSYVGLGWGPSLGTGFEVNLRTPSGFGLLAGLTWDWDRTSDATWQSRAGVRVGPTFRF